MALSIFVLSLALSILISTTQGSPEKETVIPQDDIELDVEVHEKIPTSGFLMQHLRKTGVLRSSQKYLQSLKEAMQDVGNGLEGFGDQIGDKFQDVGDEIEDLGDKVGDFVDAINDFDENYRPLVLEKYYELNDKIGDTAAIWTGEKEEINDIGDEIGDLGDKVKDFVEVESVFKKIYEEGLDDQSMVDLWGLKEYKNYKPTASKNRSKRSPFVDALRRHFSRPNLPYVYFNQGRSRIGSSLNPRAIGYGRSGVRSRLSRPRYKK